MSKRERVVEKAVKLYTPHPDMTSNRRMFFASAASTLPEVIFDKLSVDEAALVLKAMHKSHETGWRSAHDAGEPTQRFADAALDWLYKLKASRVSKTVKAEVFRLLKVAGA